mmetsp:Transcript_14066/g.31917  ORF Transcript_14066/g.31917 Transcript_14066/m.31917 type:complete len:80 (+) Transcript_14066:1586-1825(+)
MTILFKSISSFALSRVCFWARLLFNVVLDRTLYSFHLVYFGEGKCRCRNHRAYQNVFERRVWSARLDRYNNGLQAPQTR